MKKVMVVLALALSLVGCKQDYGPYWRRVCTLSHDESHLVYGRTAFSNHSTLHTQVTTVCDRYELVCEPAGKDYKGPIKTCQR